MIRPLCVPHPWHQSASAYFEPLEARALLSVSPVLDAQQPAPLAGETVALNHAQTRGLPVITRAKLTLQGTKKNDIVALDIKKNKIYFTLNGVTKTYSASGLSVVTVYLGNGNDAFTAGDAAPRLVIDAGAGNDVVVGGKRNDTLLGGKGIDSLIGGRGNDSIDGGAGQDTMYGGAGNDTLASVDGGVDILDGGTDFDTGFMDLDDAFSSVESRRY